MKLTLPNNDIFDMPAWQDCSWRRLSCQSRECPMCGKIMTQREAHIARGEDPDTPEAMMHDVEETFTETLTLMRKDATERGIDLDALEDVEIPEPPDLWNHPLVQGLREWQSGVLELAMKAEGWGSSWLDTDAGKDLLWYKNTLVVKTLRLLHGAWDLEQGNDEAEVDYLYTQYVMKECVAILDTAFHTLRADTLRDDTEAMMLHSMLSHMKKELLSL